MKKNIRKMQALKRKNFLPTLLLTVLFWILTASLVFFIDPSTFGAVPAFFALISVSLLFTFSLIFANSRRGLIATLSGVVFLILAYLGIGNVLNLFLILAIATAIDLYFTLR